MFSRVALSEGKLISRALRLLLAYEY